MDGHPFLDSFKELTLLRDYLGEKLAFYFAWLDYYTAWLFVLLPVSLVFLALQFFIGWGSANAGLTFNGVAVCLWSLLMMKFWQRKSSELAMHWDVTQIELRELPRPEFQGLPEDWGRRSPLHRWFLPSTSRRRTSVAAELAPQLGRKESLSDHLPSRHAPQRGSLRTRASLRAARGPQHNQVAPTGVEAGAGPGAQPTLGTLPYCSREYGAMPPPPPPARSPASHAAPHAARVGRSLARVHAMLSPHAPPRVPLQASGAGSTQ